jgi:hypothetical protein
MTAFSLHPRIEPEHTKPEPSTDPDGLESALSSGAANGFRGHGAMLGGVFGVEPGRRSTSKRHTHHSWKSSPCGRDSARAETSS